MRLIADRPRLLITLLPVPALAQSPQSSEDQPGGHHPRAVSGPRTEDGGEFPAVRARGFYTARCSTRHPQLHDPGRRLHPDMAQKPTRGRSSTRPQRAAQQHGLGGDGAHLGSAFASAQFFINVKDNDSSTTPAKAAGLCRLRPCRGRHGHREPHRAVRPRTAGRTPRAGHPGGDRERARAAGQAAVK